MFIIFLMTNNNQIKDNKKENKKFMPTMIVAKPLPPRARTATATTTKTTEWQKQP